MEQRFKWGSGFAGCRQRDGGRSGWAKRETCDLLNVGCGFLRTGGVALRGGPTFFVDSAGGARVIAAQKMA